MKVDYSRSFKKAIQKLSDKDRDIVAKVIVSVKNADSLQNIHNCKKLSGFNNAYRIRIGNYRLFFIFVIIEDVVYFQYLLHRGEAYNKRYLDNLRDLD